MFYQTSNKKRAGYEEGGTEFRGTCPHCGGMSFFWNPEKKLGVCLKGAAPGCENRKVQFTPPVEFDGDETPRRTKDPEYIALFQHKNYYMPHLITDADHFAEVRGYLHSRRVDSRLIQRARLRADSQKNIYFPITPINNLFTPVFLKRNIVTKTYHLPQGVNKSAGGYVYGWDLLDLDSQSIVLVEGVFDVLSPGLLGCAIALLGTQLFDSVIQGLHQKNYKTVYVWLDPDAYRASEKLVDRLKNLFPTVRTIESQYDPGDTVISESLINKIKEGRA